MGGVKYLRVQFALSDCQSCAFRPECTSSQKSGRLLSLHAREEHEALQERRVYQKTSEFAARYQIRCGIEGTICESVRVHGLRRSRYVGEAKTHLQHVLTGAALNFCRVFSWLIGEPLSTTRVSRFARLKSLGLVKAAGLAPA